MNFSTNACSSYPDYYQDTDDAELCGICRTCAVVLTALEPDNDVDIDVLAGQVSDNVEDL